MAILVTLVPFSVSALILALASLDYLGFGLPDTYASWGRLLNDGLAAPLRKLGGHLPPSPPW